MKCNSCCSEWNTTANNINICPFCGAKINCNIETISIKSTREAFNYILLNYGTEILLSKYLKSYFLDVAPKLPKSEKRLVGLLYEYGVTDIISKAANSVETDKVIAVRKAVMCLTDAYIRKDVAERIVSDLVSALNWQIKENSDNCVELINGSISEAKFKNNVVKKAEFARDLNMSIFELNSILTHLSLNSANDYLETRQCNILLEYYTKMLQVKDFSSFFRNT